MTPEMTPGITPGMTPGASTACLYPMETERALETLLRLGYRRFEVFLNAMEELSPPFLRGLGERARAYGASFVSVHPFTSAAESTLLFGDYPRRAGGPVGGHPRPAPGPRRPFG